MELILLSLGFWVSDAEYSLVDFSDSLLVAKNCSYSANPFLIPYIKQNLHCISFLMVIADLISSSSLRSSSVKEFKQLPSIDSYSRSSYKVLNFE